MMKKVYIYIYIKRKKRYIIIFTMDGCTVFFVAIVYEEREGMRHDRGGDEPNIRKRRNIYIYIYRTRHETAIVRIGRPVAGDTQRGTRI